MAGSIGPYGACQADGSEYSGAYGAVMGEEQLAAWHRPRFELLCDCRGSGGASGGGGVDVLAMETLPCLAEVRALLSLLPSRPAARCWISLACGSGSALVSGEPVADAVREIARRDMAGQVQAVGVNCTAPHLVPALIRALRGAMAMAAGGGARRKRAIVVYPNSGEDWDSDGRVWVGESASEIWRLERDAGGVEVPLVQAPLVQAAREWVELAGEGGCLVGGCCRVGPQHIRCLSAHFGGGRTTS